MDTGKIKQKILLEYGTLREFAEAAGTSESQLSRWLKHPTDKFRTILIQTGITKQTDDMVGSESEIENKTEIIKELKNIIYEKNSFINDLNNMLSKKDKLIDQYEKIIESLREKV